MRKILQKSLVKIPGDSPLFQIASGENYKGVKLHFTEGETKLFSLVKKTISAHKMKSTARVAGGWVRDKLLGRDSDDIDINLDDVSGVDFAYKMQSETTAKEMSHFGCIKSNPEKSKNLETATFDIYGISVDINHLRSEVYDNHTRVPEIKIGTPYEDAMRRDFTLNTLFYNINEDLLEDFTGHGISDLLAWNLRTPLEPLKTFLDDPLRTLRVCRFASRFGFSVDKGIIESARETSVKQSLAHKVSTERIGIEIDKILTKSAKPQIAFKLLDSMNLFSTVFHPMRKDWSDKDGPKDIFKDAFAHNSESFKRIALNNIDNLFSKISTKIGSFEAERNVWIMTSLLIPLAPYNSKNKDFTLSLMKNMNFPNRLSSRIISFVALTYRLINLTEEFVSDDKDFALEIGQWIGDAKGDWIDLCQFAQLPLELLNKGERKNALMKKLEEIPNDVEELKLTECYRWKNKNYFNGKDIAAILKIPSGPIYGEIKNEMFKWRLVNVEKTSNDCLEWMKTNYEKYKS